MLDEITLKEKVVGYNQSQKLIRTFECERIYLASDADSHLSGRVEELCAEYNVPMCSDFSSSQLGQVCGINVGCAVVGIRVQADKH